MSLSIDGHTIASIHFVGILGSGMSAIAQFLAWESITVSGSDRSYGKPESDHTVRLLQKAGCGIFPQDGSGISDSTTALCVSTAIESDNPDIAAAKQRSLPVFHRSDVLAAIVTARRTIAIAGTSGKSTVTAMVFEFLTTCGKAPSLISGAGLKRLEQQDLIGNAFRGTSDLLVIEADESDGSLVKYHPDLSVFLNLSRDHKPEAEVLELFRKLASQSAASLKNGDDQPLAELATDTAFSLDAAGDWRPDSYTLSNDGGILNRGNASFHLPLIGRHNLSNCIAALAVAEHYGCTPDDLQQATRNFQGVARRFAITRTANGITVVDDFAHNPEKIRSAVTAARSISSRVIAVYQPHGFGPTRFLRDEYRKLFGTIFGEQDVLVLLPIYYAGGTAVKDISSTDLKNDLGTTTFPVYTPEQRRDAITIIQDTATSGDCVLVMGARDPSLPLLVKEIAEQLEQVR